ncbi:MAG: hypothetical protein E6J90_08045 [Deltaproteobacteria bacterium]|nr:MAG: hypothetical protein E6J90_08045 [Deltaproteobacteria bacterium]
MAGVQLLAERARRGPPRRQRAAAGHGLDQDAQIGRGAADRDRHLERRVIVDDVRRVRRWSAGPPLARLSEQVAEDLEDARQIAHQLTAGRQRGERGQLLSAQLVQRGRWFTHYVRLRRKRHLHHNQIPSFGRSDNNPTTHPGFTSRFSEPSGHDTTASGIRKQSLICRSPGAHRSRVP